MDIDFLRWYPLDLVFQEMKELFHNQLFLPNPVQLCHVNGPSLQDMDNEQSNWTRDLLHLNRETF